MTTTETTGEATYCPEDNKLRLYVGRVPRAEFEALRAEGWAVCSKQREAGHGDFAAVWTPDREDTARRYSGGYIGDEDTGPAERAADRAERFGTYREHRIDDATQAAERYESGGQVFGHQDIDRATRAANRADRAATKALDAWDKAEYWQRRTAGVIGHALYLAEPGVRMGRIKRLESEQRKAEENAATYRKVFETWQKVRDSEDPVKAKNTAVMLANYHCHSYDYIHPRKGNKSSLWSHLTDQLDPITPKEAAELYLAGRRSPDDDESRSARWRKHYALRLAYERQMLEAEGGRAGTLDIEVGGKFKGGLIMKVNKSNATGRVVSVAVKVRKVSGWHYRIQNVRGADYALMQMDVERAKPEDYTPPTDEDRAAFQAMKKAEKEERGTISLINPTREDAERLQAIWNARAAEDDKGNNYPRKPGKVAEMTLAEYQNKCKDYRTTTMLNGAKARIVFAGYYNSVHSVVVLTDKPQKAFPARVWETYAEQKQTPEPEQEETERETETKPTVGTQAELVFA